LKEDLWLQNAKHANAMAQQLASQIEGIPGIKISREVESNAVFAYVKPELIPLLQKKYHFYMWDEETSEVRWMTAWDTTAEVIQEFVECIRDVVHG
jgi:threonine aldolase